MTSMTRPGTSIGAQKARGDFVGRDSMSRWTFSCACSSIPSPARVPSRAGSIPSPGKPVSHSLARKRRGTSQRYPDPPPEQRIERTDVDVLGLREEALALRAELLEREAEAVVEVAVGRRA